jgi:hypothetical protein
MRNKKAAGNDVFAEHHLASLSGRSFDKRIHLEDGVQRYHHDLDVCQVLLFAPSLLRELAMAALRAEQHQQQGLFFGKASLCKTWRCRQAGCGTRYGRKA